MKTIKPKTLEDDELDAIFAAVRKTGWPQRRNAALLALLEATGLRVSEALALTQQDLTMVGSGDIWKVSVPDEPGCKTGWREVPFWATDRIREWFLPYLYHEAAGEHLFETTSGKPLTANSFRRWLDRKAVEAGLEKHVTPHMLRHTYATRRVRAGWERPAVQQALGHKSPQTTDIYFHADIKRLVELVEKEVPEDEHELLPIQEHGQ